MKLSHAIIFAAAAILLTACNFTLAEDITPPPGYVPPTPMPTLGPLYPSSAPNVFNGAAIYAGKCAACHGERGMGDGEQGKQLPVPVAALGLPETARKATPAQWFTTVTQGNLDRFMPPFTSLSEQERWDVVAYALTLHTSPEQIEQGKALFQSNCEYCVVDFFMNQEKMAALSNIDLVRIIKEGNEETPALGGNLTEDEQWAVAAYLRTLTSASSSPAEAALASPQASPATSVNPEAGMPPAKETPIEGTPQAEVLPEATVTASSGTVSGTIENKTGAALPSDLKVTLRGFEHGADPNTGPREVFTAEATVQADGSFLFENVALPENRIFLAQTTHDGIQYQSDFAVVAAGATEVLLPTFAIYGTTNDASALTVDALQIFFDYANESSVQIFSIYTFLNTSDKTIVVSMGQGQEVPFIKFPAGAQSQGYEATQDSAAFVPTADGFAMPPAETPYGLIAFASIPKEKKIEISQPVVMSIGTVTLFLPEGVKASGEALNDEGVQTLQNTNFNLYTTKGVEAGASLDFTLTGFPKQASATADLTQNQTLLIGVGALGLALILAGVWMYLRERNRVEEDTDDEESEYDDPEDIMDAIVTLDDLHRAGKISDEVYQKRRAELKARLKEEL